MWTEGPPVLWRCTWTNCATARLQVHTNIFCTLDVIVTLSRSVLCSYSLLFHNTWSGYIFMTPFSSVRPYAKRHGIESQKRYWAILGEATQMIELTWPTSSQRCDEGELAVWLCIQQIVLYCHIVLQSTRNLTASTLRFAPLHSYLHYLAPPPQQQMPRHWF